MQKAQVAMEYMVIVGFITLMIVPLFLLYYTQYEGTHEQIRSNEADQIARKIIDASEAVYYLGAPTKTTIRVYIPARVDSIDLLGSEVVFVMRTRFGVDEVVRASPVYINGTIDSSEGIRTLTVESHGDYVTVTSR